jgi:hypothetical protein
MEILDLKKLIKKQKSTNDKNIYAYIDLKFFPNSAKCIICNNSIFYDGSSYKISNSTIKKIGKSDELTKKVNETTYNLCVCESCLIDKFPSYKLKTKNRVFNTLNDITCFAFNINESDKQIQRKKLGITLENSINRHGDIKGREIYENYCKLQAEKNKFEYKKLKYGWTKSEFDEFNKSRAITEKNLISKYGDTEGKIRFENYKAKQAYVGNSKDYFIEKYGYVEGLKKYANVCKQKGITSSNLIRLYGNEIGLKKYKEFIEKTTSHLYSNVSQELFSTLDKSIEELNLTTYYATKNMEFGKYLKSLGKYVKLDYFINELNLCIEFNGDLYHANPEIYSANDKAFFFNKKLKAIDIWKNDLERYKTLNEEHNITTIVIWESDYNLNKTQIINNLKEKIWNLTMNLRK